MSLQYVLIEVKDAPAKQLKAVERVVALAGFCIAPGVFQYGGPSPEDETWSPTYNALIQLSDGERAKKHLELRDALRAAFPSKSDGEGVEVDTSWNNLDRVDWDATFSGTEVEQEEEEEEEEEEEQQEEENEDDDALPERFMRNIDGKTLCDGCTTGAQDVDYPPIIDEGTYTCDKCGDDCRAVKPDERIAHHHNDAPDEDNPEWLCDDCYSEEDSAKYHEGHENEVIKCGSCGDWFVGK